MFSHTNFNSSDSVNSWRNASLQIALITFERIHKKIQKSHSNVFCLPVDPLSFRHNFINCDPHLTVHLRESRHYISLKMAWSYKIRRKMLNCGFYSPSLLHNADFCRTNTHTHGKRHRTPKNDVVSLASYLKVRRQPLIATLAF